MGERGVEGSKDEGSGEQKSKEYSEEAKERQHEEEERARKRARRWLKYPICALSFWCEFPFAR